MRSIPVGLERVIYTAATDEEFCEALFQDRDSAVRVRGLSLQPSERAMLLGIPREQLLATIQGVDTSPQNVRRRVFLGAVAGGAMVVAASACGDDESVKGIRPDGEVDLPAATGIRPDAWPDGTPPSDSAAPDSAAPDTAPADTVVVSDMASFGIRPHD